MLSSLKALWLWASAGLMLVPAVPLRGQVPAAPVGGDTTVAALLSRGDALYRRFDHAAALDAYRSAYARAPESFDVLLRLARTHNDLAQDLLAAGSKQAAEEHFVQAVAFAEQLREHHPERPETYFFLAATNGNLARFRGGKEKVRIGRAVETYARKAIELDSTYALPYVALGIFYREVSELSWVQRTFAKVLFGDVPSGSKEDAVAMLQRALALDSTLVIAHYELAMTYLAMDRASLAIPHLRRVLALPPFTSQDRRNREKARQLLAELTGGS
ncbi:tetratricopeptide repeat protein [Rhodocaloribacter litoris]|uniref:tetratricopeptide repeat protein n=1 Tax=Rhodocaloribacter litoris TaxID=2558931 RepID=UPI0014226563|nr:tetratricopeptide repeat protein [Rhodocaloribacter litoris]QXD14619.1 tetratricopeptide repeat protein [Rhodocaloribacter litoris]GIV59609.1 MAG: hypothetical protein KatS3mg043_0698 [Rhodothermaceae bacterium]